MTNSQLSAFVAAARASDELQSSLKAAKTTEEVVAIAKQAGFVIDASDLGQDSLSDEELESVAGGAITITCFNSHGTKSAGIICIGW